MKTLNPLTCLLIPLTLGLSTQKLLAQGPIITTHAKAINELNAIRQNKSGTRFKIMNQDGSNRSVDSPLSITPQALTNARQILWSDSITAVPDDEQQSLKGKLKDVNLTRAKKIPVLFFDNGSAAQERKLYALIFLDSPPLQYDTNRKSFQGTLSFVLTEVPVNPETSDYKLHQPLTVQITSRDIKGINPKNLTLTHLYTPSEEITLESDAILNKASIKIITPAKPDGFETTIPVKPALQVLKERTTMQGLGIQQIPITVRFLGSDSNQSMNVSVATSQGTVTPRKLNLKFNESATVMLRSEGLGETTILASSPDNQKSQIIIRFLFPWIFLIAAIGGGTLGAVARHFSSTGRKSLSRSIVLGMTLGLISAIAFYVLGIKMIEMDTDRTFNEMAVFGLAALTAFFGVRQKQYPQ